jgi:hypothetical protein
LFLGQGKGKSISNGESSEEEQSKPKPLKMAINKDLGNLRLVYLLLFYLFLRWILLKVKIDRNA